MCRLMTQSILTVFLYPVQDEMMFASLVYFDDAIPRHENELVPYSIKFSNIDEYRILILGHLY